MITGFESFCGQGRKQVSHILLSVINGKYSSEREREKGKRRMLCFEKIVSLCCLSVRITSKTSWNRRK